jgi:hypothetical protein
MSPGASKKMKSARAREKHLNVSDFGLIEEGAMRRARDKAIRISVVLTTVVAWLSISNHCAVGGMVAAKTQSPMAQMHCHGSQPSPSKKSSDEEIPCCKLLRATITSGSNIVGAASKDFLPIQSWIVAELIFADEAQFHRTPQELNTGPPFAGSFAESVLQRSILAHAPPLLA